MALDPSIALGVKPLEVANPLAQYAQTQQIQHYQQQNALAQRAMAQEDAMNQAMANSVNRDTGKIDPAMLSQNVIASGYGAQLPKIQKAMLDTAHVQAQTDDLTIKALGGTFDNFTKMNPPTAAATSPEGVASYITNLYSNPLLGAVAAKQMPLEQAIKVNQDAALKDPNAWITAHSGLTGAHIFDTLKGTRQNTNLGGVNRGETVDAYGRPVAGTAVNTPMTATPGELLTDTRAKERETRLAQGPMGTGLSAEQHDALYGENGAVARGLVNPNRIKSVATAKMYADTFIRNPNANPVKIGQEVAASDAAFKSFMGDGKAAQKVESANTAIGHLQSLKDLYAAQQNNDTRAFNAAANAISSQFGGAAPTNLQMAVQIVGPEIAKSVIGTSGSMREREEFVSSLSGKAASPAQFAGAIDTTTGLLTTRLGEVENSYKRQTKRDDFRSTFLNPTSRAILDKSSATTAPATNVPAIKFLGFEPQK
jgi:hypothetical protein